MSLVIIWIFQFFLNVIFHLNSNYRPYHGFCNLWNHVGAWNCNQNAFFTSFTYVFYQDSNQKNQKGQKALRNKNCFDSSFIIQIWKWKDEIFFIMILFSSLFLGTPIKLRCHFNKNGSNFKKIVLYLLYFVCILEIFFQLIKNQFRIIWGWKNLCC